MLSRSIRRMASKATLPDLPYDLNDLAPILTKELLQLHWGKHHQKYVDEFNMYSELCDSAKQKGDYNLMLRFAEKVKFAGGGHFNHAFLWESMSPVNKHGGVLPSADSKLGKAIKNSFTSFDAIIERSVEMAKDIQGSGWIWLAFDPKLKALTMTITKDQDTVSQLGLEPLLNIDVWEHAFYLNYLNRKEKYMQEIWKVVNWKKAEERFNKLV